MIRITEEDHRSGKALGGVGFTDPGDITLNSDWYFNIGSQPDLYSVLLHESGHSLGLDHSTSGTVMYGAITGVYSGLTPDDIAGIRAPEDLILDGTSLLPEFLGDTNIGIRPLFWHFPIYLEGGNEETQDPLFRTRPGTAVRYGDWKLIEYFENGELELYNLKDDIGETTNLASEFPEKLHELKLILDKWRQETDAPVPQELNPEYLSK